jgi:hypothetical protein
MNEFPRFVIAASQTEHHFEIFTSQFTPNLSFLKLTYGLSFVCIFSVPLVG